MPHTAPLNYPWPPAGWKTGWLVTVLNCLRGGKPIPYYGWAAAKVFDNRAEAANYCAACRRGEFGREGKRAKVWEF